jgi:hypothetical protein
VPVLLAFVAVLLAVEGAAALRTGHLTTAGVCLGGLIFVGHRLGRYRSGELPSTSQARLASPSRCPEDALLALIYPEQADRVDELLAAVEGSPEAFLVLAVTSGDSGLTAGASSIGQVLARRVAAAGRDLAFMNASGDPAVTVLDFARQARASRVLLLRGVESSDEEERQRCASVSRGLPLPRSALVVELVLAGASPLRIELDPEAAISSEGAS